MTYVQEYPKWVPGPDGAVIVKDADEELDVLTKRVAGLSQRPALTINRIETHERSMEAQFMPVEIDIDAWLRARNTPSHDWIGALYRPYVSPV